jgi:hypothetical protein
MKKTVVLLFVVLFSQPLFAEAGRSHGFHHRFGHHRFLVGTTVFVGPVWGPPWWSDPYWAYPPPIVIQEEPPVYIQQSQPGPPAVAYWYYCPDSKAYYPYVQHCPTAWLKVAPQTTPSHQ